MSDMIRGPMGPDGSPEKLQFNTFEDEKGQKEAEGDDKHKKERMAVRLASLGIDTARYSEEELEKIVEVLQEQILASKNPNDLLAGVLDKYGFDMSKRNLPPGAITVVLNSILSIVVLSDRSGISARNAIEKILKKHQVAAKNPFGL